MKYPKLFVGDKIIIDGLVYMVTAGLSPNIDKRRANRKTYHVTLRAMKWHNGDTHAERLYMLNTELSSYEKETN